MPALAQHAETKVTPKPAAAAGQAPGLPADSTTQQTVDLPGRRLDFTAVAGSLPLSSAAGVPQAEIAYTAYLLDVAEVTQRPVTFVVNGGPGASSAWLQFGAAGPWRLPLEGAGASLSAPPALQPNAETWLDFTDLVFIDPVGTGYSGFLAEGEELRRRYWSVEGDIASLAEVIRRWLVAQGRLQSPKFLLGESYGGFRGPLLARALQADQGIGLRGLVLVSPALDLSGRDDTFAPLRWVGRLPSMAAVHRAASGPVDRQSLADVERYAAGDFLLDLVRGERDGAPTRLTERVAALTGLDPELVRRRRGRIGLSEFLRGAGPDQRIASAYDATVTMPDPFPADDARVPDPVLDALVPPLTSAVLALYGQRLGWRLPDRRYHLLNQAVFHQWQWGRGDRPPEAMTDLRTALALDPALRVVIVHGLYDLVTPYFASAILLDQIPIGAGGDRVSLLTLAGGHMFYTATKSRQQLREVSRTLIGR
ncbi:peptidase S10 [Roseomonas vastitatis]|uniref:Peptidase S10 n=1 Tax=Teichococcus vastitatis TaxID=2307076 RepID=A0ABS9WAH8_9PROT|nr:peptidase S10 [Pseudoroseomonas vastitatis]